MARKRSSKSLEHSPLVEEFAKKISQCMDKCENGKGNLDSCIRKCLENLLDKWGLSCGSPLAKLAAKRATRGR